MCASMGDMIVIIMDEVNVVVDMVDIVGLKMNGDDYGHGACGCRWWWC